MPRTASSPRPAATPTSSRSSASATSCWRSTRSTSSASTRQRFAEIRDAFAEFAAPLELRERRRRSRCRPATATTSSTRSARTPWYGGPTLLEHLETVDVEDRDGRGRSACRCSGSTGPTASFRGYAGTVAAGTVRPGDAARRRPHRPDRAASPASSPWTATATRPSAGDAVTLTTRPRDRHQPRRHACRRPTAARRSPTRSPRTSSGWRTSRCCPAAPIS